MPEEPKQDPYLSEVRRMCGLEFTPPFAQGWAELGRVLKKRSKSLEHASRIVGRFLEPGAPTRCPTPGELAQMAQSVPADAGFDRQDLPAACPNCAPYGGSWRIVNRGGAEGTDRCDCPRGRRLGELDALRGQPAKRPVQHLERASAEDWAKRAAGDLERP